MCFKGVSVCLSRGVRSTEDERGHDTTFSSEALDDGVCLLGQTTTPSLRRHPAHRQSAGRVATPPDEHQELSRLSLRS